MLAQFRCGILPLRIETGRFSGEPEDSRLCKMCSKNEIESETHFLINCDFYNELRNELYSTIPSKETFLSLPHCEQLIQFLIYFPRRTAKYILQAFTKRRQFIYVIN